MKRHSDKKFINSGILEKLKNTIFYHNNKKYCFYMWDYSKNRLYFNFREEKDAKKSIYENAKSLTVQLFYQHIDNYKNTFSLICETFNNKT